LTPAIYALPRYEYSYYITLLPCNQFHWGRRGQRSRTATETDKQVYRPGNGDIDHNRPKW